MLSLLHTIPIHTHTITNKPNHPLCSACARCCYTIHGAVDNWQCTHVQYQLYFWKQFASVHGWIHDTQKYWNSLLYRKDNCVVLLGMVAVRSADGVDFNIKRCSYKILQWPNKLSAKVVFIESLLKSFFYFRNLSKDRSCVDRLTHLSTTRAHCCAYLTNAEGSDKVKIMWTKTSFSGISAHCWWYPALLRSKSTITHLRWPRFLSGVDISYYR